TDTVSASGAPLNCYTQRSLDVDTSWISFLTGLFGFVFPPAAILPGLELIGISGFGPPAVPSPACAIVTALIPDQISLGGGLIMVGSYNRVRVSPAVVGGVVAG